MRYLVLSADYLEYSIRVVGSGDLDLTALPAALKDSLELWNGDYQDIVRSEVDRRTPDVWAKIESLDRRGLELAEALRSSLADVAEVRYFSEGRLAYYP